MYRYIVLVVFSTFVFADDRRATCTCATELTSYELQKADEVVVFDTKGFTIAADAFSKGVAKILLTDTSSHAAQLKERFEKEEAMLIDENGIKTSPTQFKKLDASWLTGRTLIMCTSATKRIMRSGEDRVLASSFLVANATIEYLRNNDSHEVAFVASDPDTFYDYADNCLALFSQRSFESGDFMEAEYCGEAVYNLWRCRSKSKKRHIEDFDLATILRLNEFNFVMEANREHDDVIGVYYTLKKVELCS